MDGEAMRPPLALALLLLATFAEGFQVTVLPWERHGRPVLSTAVAASRIQCGVRCGHTVNCEAIAFNGPGPGGCLALGCPDGQSLNGVCQSCPAGWIIVAGGCRRCPGGQVAVNNTCVECPRWWSPVYSACFRVDPTMMSFISSKKHCNKLVPGATLASFSSLAENNFVAGLLQPSGSFGSWIGLEHLPSYNADEFRWLDGNSINFTNWRPRTPNGDMTVHLGVWMGTDEQWMDSNAAEGRWSLVCKYVP